MSISLTSEVEWSLISLIAGSCSTLHVTREGGYKRKIRWQEWWGMGGEGWLFEGGDCFRFFLLKGAYLIKYSWSDYFSLWISVTSGFRLETAIPLLLREITLLSQHNEISIAFPDDGAFKRFHAMFSSFPTITCTKLREGDKRIVRVKDGNITIHSLYLMVFSRNISVLSL